MLRPHELALLLAGLVAGVVVALLILSCLAAGAREDEARREQLRRPW